MKKLIDRRGFSLVEMLAAVAILVILVVGMDAGIKAGLRAYDESMFESNSAALSGIINTAVGDILRYSEAITVNPALNPENIGLAGFEDMDGNILPPEVVPFVFSNYEYGIRNAYFYTKTYKGGSSHGILELKDLQNNPVRELVNSGAYPDLEITDFEVDYVSGDCFDVSYRILDKNKEGRDRNVSYTVRVLNPED